MIPLAERFKAPQGEGVFAGVPMAFMRTVGCSVGQKTCTHCDTDFLTMNSSLGGGKYEPEELIEWVRPYRHACITGGEPLDRDIRPLISALADDGVRVHVETSGTKLPDWIGTSAAIHGRRMVAFDQPDGRVWQPVPLWITVSPKPGWLPEMVKLADELKVILGGLGDGPGWPTLADAVRWADHLTVPVYVQPRNLRFEVDRGALAAALAAVDEFPTLRLSVQLHKFLRTR